MTVYKGRRLPGGGVEVTRDGRAFSPAASLKVRNHSPDGFQWGYGGSGPAQLALALLLDVIGRSAAVCVYQDFKFQHVGRWGDTWQVTEAEIVAWYLKHLEEFPAREVSFD